MYIIQHTGILAPELKGKIVGKGKTVNQAIKNMIKNVYSHDADDFVFTNDKHYVYVNGEGGYKITKS